MAAPLARLGARQRPDSRIAGVRIGVQSYSFRDRSLDAAIAAMAEIGLSYCELWSAHLIDPLSRPPEWSAQRRRWRRWLREDASDIAMRVRERFDRAGMTLTAYNPSLSPEYTDDEISMAFEVGRLLGVRVITVSSPVSLAPRLDLFARNTGMTVGFHNHSQDRDAPGGAITPDDFARAMTGTSERIAVNLDIGHFTAANFDAVDYLERHHDRIVSLHIKDRRREQGPNVAFGEGDTPIAAVLTRLRDRGWDIPAHIEYEYRGEDTVAEIRRSLEYCRRVLVAGALAPADRTDGGRARRSAEREGGSPGGRTL